jgi:hypothetical protein
MRIIIRRLASVLAIAALSTAVVAAAAPAAPVNAPNAQEFTLDCGDAGTLVVVVNGNGPFTPGHLVDGPGVGIPVAFGEATIVVRDAEGNVIDEFTEPGTTKGRARARGRERVTCAFTDSFTEDGVTVTISGSVTAILSGPRS